MSPLSVLGRDKVALLARPRLPKELFAMIQLLPHKCYTSISAELRLKTSI